MVSRSSASYKQLQRINSEPIALSLCGPTEEEGTPLHGPPSELSHSPRDSIVKMAPLGPAG